MALYSIGATWNPEMSQYNRSIKRGLAGIRGLNFAYRLNTWGPKNGPAMLPANAFRSSYVPTPQGLSSPLTWIEGVFGIESPQDMLTDAQNSLDGAIAPLNGAQTVVQNILSQAQAYDSVTDSRVQAKAQAVEAEAAGLVNIYQNLQSAAQAIINQITGAKGDPNTTKATAQSIKDQIPALKSQVSDFSDAVSTLQDHMAALVKYAQAGPGLGQTLESAAVGSISTLTWILGGGALIYFLAPTFLPRLIRGFSK
jgi:gas vesicle protein